MDEREAAGTVASRVAGSGRSGRLQRYSQREFRARAGSIAVGGQRAAQIRGAQRATMQSEAVATFPDALDVLDVLPQFIEYFMLDFRRRFPLHSPIFLSAGWKLSCGQNQTLLDSARLSSFHMGLKDLIN
jgi:hypothetical protein